MKKFSLLLAAVLFSGWTAIQTNACTGITLEAEDGSRIMARTVEWAATPMHTGYVVAPRTHFHQSYTPSGQDGMVYRSRYGYVGVYTEYEPFVVEGINETGLSVGLFFFPQYGSYKEYKPSRKSQTLCDMQFVSWALSQFSTIDQLKQALSKIDLVSLDHRLGSVHWRIAEPGGRIVVLEYKDGVPVFYENPLGVLTNAPEFSWHMTHLNQYVNLYTGSASSHDLTEGVTLNPLGGGSGMIGLPGDFTPPSRFVRAAFVQSSAPVQENGWQSVKQAFHLLNLFDLPVGMQHKKGQVPKDMPSATQFTVVSDLKSAKLYYKTMWNSEIRCIELKSIDFGEVSFQSHPLDDEKEQAVKIITIR